MIKFLTGIIGLTLLALSMVAMNHIIGVLINFTNVSNFEVMLAGVGLVVLESWLILGIISKWIDWVVDEKTTR